MLQAARSRVGESVPNRSDAAQDVFGKAGLSWRMVAGSGAMETQKNSEAADVLAAFDRMFRPRLFVILPCIAARTQCWMSIYTCCVKVRAQGECCNARYVPDSIH